MSPMALRLTALLLASVTVAATACFKAAEVIIPDDACEPSAGDVSGPAPELTSAAHEWPSANRDLAGTRATFDSSIDAASVGRLSVAWTYALEPNAGANGSAATNPLIASGAVYVADLASNIHAIDLRTGDPRRRIDNDAPVFGPNGVAVGWGRVFASVGGTTIAAYDAACGAELWTTKLTDDNRGAVNIQPVVAGRLVLAATSSLSIPGSRGVLYGLDAATGAVVWSFDTIESPDMWGRPDINSGGGAWYPPAVDAAAGLVFWGTSSPYPFPGAEGFPNASSRPGDNRWTDSVVALDLESGELRWAYQLVAHDLFDRDSVLTAIAAVEGPEGTRPVVINTGKHGRVAAFDPGDGTRLWDTAVGQHWNDDLTAFEGELWVLPGVLGGVITPIATAEGVVYVAVVNAATYYSSPEETSSGFTTALGQIASQVVALDAASGEVLWDVELKGDSFGGATVVNDLVFVSLLHGRVIALDRATGSEVWSMQLEGGINGWPAVAGDTIVVPVGHGEQPAIVALRLD